MVMLKSNSNVLSFEQLMAQATQVAKKQDAHLLERAKQKIREAEEKRRQDERLARERYEQEARNSKKRELNEQKQRSLIDQKKQQRVQEKKRATSDKSLIKSKGPMPSKMTSFLPEKKKQVHMSFDDLMKKAKEQSVNKDNIVKKVKRPADKMEPHETSSIYNRQKRIDMKVKETIPDTGLSARDRAKMIVAEPPKKVLGQKKDRRTIAEVQKELRHAKGIYSDDEDDRKKDPRLMSKNKPTQPRYHSSHDTIRKRPLSPLPRTQVKRNRSPVKRPLSPIKRLHSPIKRSRSPVRPMKKPLYPINDRKPNPPPLRRMPFSGRPLDAPRKPLNKRPMRDDEEEDEELASFIVDDEEEYDEGPQYARGYHKNSYSDEISRIFRYDKSKYANDPVFSDDDMEADAREVLREEKRSERLARREDLLEEQREMERLKRRKR